MNDELYMKRALELAQKAYDLGEVPVGAIIVRNGEIISEGFNKRESKKNALMHAEIEAIDKACKTLGGWRLFDCEMYVTLEPCQMCKGAITNARIKRVVYGAPDLNHPPYIYETVSGILESECSEILTKFFKKMR